MCGAVASYGGRCGCAEASGYSGPIRNTSANPMFTRLPRQGASPPISRTGEVGRESKPLWVCPVLGDGAMTRNAGYFLTL